MATCQKNTATTLEEAPNSQMWDSLSIKINNDSNGLQPIM